MLVLVLGGLGRDALKAAVGVALLAVLAILFATASVAGVGAVLAPGGVVLDARAGEVPPEQRAVMERAAMQCGLPWQVLAGIAKVESDFGRNMATSSAGAIGYGQFLPNTWAAYGAGGDPYAYRDAIPAMARYLCANGGPADLRRAIFAYNRADWYVDDVLAAAITYGYRAPGAPAGGVVDVARSQLGMPYVWGGASPATSFDCSGLMQWSFGRVGVRLPRTAQEQYDATARVPRDQLQPGDLLFFSGTDSADPAFITHVGLYAGGGLMISASNPSTGVEEVPALSGYWGAHYAGAGRVIATG